MIPPGSDVEGGPVVHRRTIIIGRRRVRRGVTWVNIGWGWRRRLVHVEMNALRDAILMCKMPPGAERSSLDELIRMKREGLDNVIIRTKIVESAVLIAKNL